MSEPRVSFEIRVDSRKTYFASGHPNQQVKTVLAELFDALNLNEEGKNLAHFQLSSSPIGSECDAFVPETIALGRISFHNPAAESRKSLVAFSDSRVLYLLHKVPSEACISSTSGGGEGMMPSFVCKDMEVLPYPRPQLNESGQATELPDSLAEYVRSFMPFPNAS